MTDVEVRILPEVEDFLDTLPYVLLQEGYKASLEYAEKYVDNILDFISTLPYIPHHTVSPEFAYHFLRYGHNLQYAFFRRKKSKTTWYVFFERKGNLLLVKHITNNWQEGHYIR